MQNASVVFRKSKSISARAVRALFRRMKWHHWLSESDVAWYLRHALFVASAWAGSRCVGIAIATGDGRVNAWLDTLVVDGPYQGKGIGTELTRTVVERVERQRPCCFGLDVYQRRTEDFYAKFGFVRNKGTWLLEHKPTADRLRSRVRRG
jgi:GNAT superfamily N-acetyltransferase